MKQRFTYLDIRAIVNELQEIPQNAYIQNVYSPTNRIYVLKLSIKKFLLVEPGTRIQILKEYANDIDDEKGKTHLSFFCTKMRLFLRRNKIKEITQIGFDRVIKIETNKYNIYCEFFSSGNIIITPLDSLDILEVFRPVKELGIEKGSTYVINPIELDFSYKTMLRVGMREMLGLDKIIYEDIKNELDCVLKPIGYKIHGMGDIDSIFKCGEDHQIKDKNQIMDPENNNKKQDSSKLFKAKNSKKSVEKVDSVKIKKSTTNEKSNGKRFTGKQKVSNTNFSNDNNVSLSNISCELLKSKKNSFINLETLSDNFKSEETKLENSCNDQKNLEQITDTKNNICKGKNYEKDEILINTYNNYFKNLLEKFKNIKDYGLLLSIKGKYNNYIPYKLSKPVKNITLKEFLSFNDSLEEYYKKEEKKSDDKKKSKAVKIRQERRIEELEDNIVFCDTKIDFLRSNQELIEKILEAHKNVITYNLNWADFERHKKAEPEINSIIKKSDFMRRSVSIKLENDKKKEEIFDLNFEVNFNGNINFIYEQKKKLKEKLEKTRINIENVIKSVEKKEMKKGKKKIEKIKRKLYWFEKFHYFFTTKNKLVIGGKSAQDNDIIVKKYLDKGDLYFHAEIQGGSSVVLKNADLEDLESIEQAASMALCLSNCWKGRVSTRVYFVNYDQVSKTTESGEYLKTGGFMIRGKKTFVDVFRLEYGIGILFKVKKEEIKEKCEEYDSENLLDELKSLKINKARAENIDYNFVKKPEPKQKIEHAILVCGPWISIKNFTFKEKLLPAVEKKGKIAAELFKRFNHEAKETDLCDSVRNIVIDEYTGVLINDCKIGKR